MTPELSSLALATLIQRRVGLADVFADPGPVSTSGSSAYTSSPVMSRAGLWFVAVAACLNFSAVRADSVDGQWRIVGFQGEPWFVDTESLIGEAQMFQGGVADGPLYACDFAGQSMTYTTYENEAFFSNPEFALFADLKDGMTLSSSRLFFHRVTCNGGGDPQKRRVLYPFVTNEARASAWYLYEGGVFSLFRP